MAHMQNTTPKLRWHLKDADAPLKLFITVFLFMLSTGYIIGLSFVDHTSDGTVQGLEEQYRGQPESSEATELKYAKGADEMYVFLHNHILSLSMVFFCVGIIFYFTAGTSPALKKFLMVEPLIAIGTTFGGIWLMWFVSGYFSWLVIISGVSMVGCYFIMVGLILKELWLRR